MEEEQPHRLLRCQAGRRQRCRLAAPFLPTERSEKARDILIGARIAAGTYVAPELHRVAHALLPALQQIWLERCQDIPMATVIAPLRGGSERPGLAHRVAMDASSRAMAPFVFPWEAAWCTAAYRSRIVVFVRARAAA
jgi:hypothetical protein